MIISYVQAKHLLDGFLLQEKEVKTSLDLGMSHVTVKVHADEFEFPDGQRLHIKVVRKIAEDYKVCYEIRDNEALKVSAFSETSRKFYKLMPTQGAPTLEISGIRMHITKDQDPWESAKKMVAEIKPVQGKVLDTCCGLGYSAINALNAGAASVVVCEVDENCLEVAKHNPWSQQLFSDDIEIVKKDVFEYVKYAREKYFNRIIHDPPSFSRAGLLYSLGFYKELFRIMKSDGILYHYTGLPGSKKRGINLIQNVIGRLKRAGFKEVEPTFYGVRAIRP